MYRLEPQMFHELFFIKQGKIKTNDFSCLQFSVRLKNVTKIWKLKLEIYHPVVALGYYWTVITVIV